jgi:hypothetical protein
MKSIKINNSKYFKLILEIKKINNAQFVKIVKRYFVAFKSLKIIMTTLPCNEAWGKKKKSK